MYNHNKAQQSKNRVHIYWDILYELTFQTIPTIWCELQHYLTILLIWNQSYRDCYHLYTEKGHNYLQGPWNPDIIKNNGMKYLQGKQLLYYPCINWILGPTLPSINRLPPSAIWELWSAHNGRGSIQASWLEWHVMVVSFSISTTCLNITTIRSVNMAKQKLGERKRHGKWLALFV